ncbi:MAG: PAN domain-containing protein [Nitrospira sp.]|nr:PAN domain-containing protein [Nitrospira sp.]
MGELSFTTASQTSTFARRVISLHGIRTTGAWQKELNDTLEEHHLLHSPFDYGYLKLAMFLNPRRRDREIDKFRDWVTNYISTEHQPPSVIAHSFGTYIVAKALLKYEELKLDRLILCGSILEKNYPWAKIVERGQVRGVLNESGSKDVWVKLVAWIVKDAGPSGVEGFSDKVDGIVADIHRDGFKHSDYFYSLHVQNVWIPFLKGTALTELEKAGNSKRPKNLKFQITQIALVILILSVAILGYYFAHYTPGTIRTKPTPAKKFVEFTGKEPCPFGGTHKMREHKMEECEVMDIDPSTRPPKFHRTEGQLFYSKENGKCPYHTKAFAGIREDGSRCIIEAPNNIALYHTLNTVYYLPFSEPGKMEEPKSGWDLYGDDYRDFPVKGQGSEDVCLNECALDKNCKAFSFSSTANRCWLKYRIPEVEVEASGIVSGKKQE